MTYDFIVIGGGLVGLATARELLSRFPQKRIALLEKEDRWAPHQSSRNSGVIHAGVYYAPGSLRAQLGVKGNASMHAFCREYGIAHDQCGKIIVATRGADLPRLDALANRAHINGLDVLLMGPEAAREIEPHVNCVGALKVPATGIVDFGDVAREYARQIQIAGGELHLQHKVADIVHGTDSTTIITTRGEFETRYLVNCGGLYCDRIAHLDGVDPEMRIVPFRGEYYELKAQRRYLVKNLIYPMPNLNFPFLGVHLTRLVDGSIHAGPNAVLAFAREGYNWGTINLRDLTESLAYSGFRKLAGRYLFEGLSEMWRSLVKASFVATLRELVPELESKDLKSAESGVRAQALRSNGTLIEDFFFKQNERALHVLNAPSPAATASLEIARYIVNRIEQSE